MNIFKHMSCLLRCHPTRNIKSIFVSFVVLGLSNGCTGLQTFSQVARPGDTVTLAIDWQPNLSREDVTFRITDSSNSYLDIPGTDPSIRSWINAYPDPISKAVVGRETKQELNVQASAWGAGIDNETGGDKDWFDTFVILDLPINISAGTAHIDVLIGNVSILSQPIAVEILPGSGSPYLFDIAEWGPTTANQILSMERADHNTVTFSGSQIPAAIQIDFTHDPDRENGGTGQAYVVHPRGDIKSVAWTDNGTALRVILTPSWHKTPEDANAINLNAETFQWFKFYVAGGIKGLQSTSVNAYDINGNPVTGLSVTIQ